MVFQIPFNRKNSIFRGEITLLYRLNFELFFLLANLAY